MHLTPNHIEVLLHYHCFTDKHPNEDAPAVKAALDFFLKEDILRLSKGDFTTTERGKAFVTMLCTTPLPTKVWVNPLTNGIVSPF